MTAEHSSRHHGLYLDSIILKLNFNHQCVKRPLIDTNALCKSQFSMAQCASATPLAGGAGCSNERDEQGRTPVMLAVLGGRFDAAVQLALSGADLSQQDAAGRTALALAIEMQRREVALALFLIATVKFTRPLPSLLRPQLLQQLHMWLSSSGPEKEAAMQVLLQQYSDHLAASGPGATGHHYHATASAAVIAPQVAAGLVEMLAWAGRHALSPLIDALVAAFSLHSSRSLPPTTLALARSSEGLSVLHALVLAGQPAAVAALLAALPPAEAAVLRAHRDARGREASRIDPAVAPPTLQPAVSAAVHCLAVLPPTTSMMLPPPPRPPPVPAATAAYAKPALTPSGNTPVPRSFSSPGWLAPGVAVYATATSSCPAVGSDDSPMGDDVSEAAALLEFANGACASLAGAFAIGSGPATHGKGKRGGGRRVAKFAPGPALHGARGAGRGEWETNACTGHKLNSVLPPGRQPGELAGWTPLAGEANQRAFCEQRQALNHTEALVQGLESRDAAVQYLSQLRHHETSFAPESQHIVSAVDDSAIEMSGEKSTPFKRLATWGGFRRHHTKAQRALASREAADSGAQTFLGTEDSFESTGDISEAKMRERQASETAMRATGAPQAATAATQAMAFCTAAPGACVAAPPAEAKCAKGSAAGLSASEVAVVREKLRLNATEARALQAEAQAAAEALAARLRQLEAERLQLEQMLS